MIDRELVVGVRRHSQLHEGCDSEAAACIPVHLVVGDGGAAIIGYGPREGDKGRTCAYCHHVGRRVRNPCSIDCQGWGRLDTLANAVECGYCEQIGLARCQASSLRVGFHRWSCGCQLL